MSCGFSRRSMRTIGLCSITVGRAVVRHADMETWKYPYLDESNTKRYARTVRVV